MRVFEAPAIGNQITLGKLHFYRREYYGLAQGSELTAQQEERRYLRAREQSVEELMALHAQAGREMHQTEADIFAIHAMLLEDADFDRRVREMILKQGVTAQYAMHIVGREFVNTFKGMDDPYMRARAIDIRDIMRRVILRLVNIHPDHSLNHRSTILVSKYILPSEVMELDRNCILGIVSMKGSLDSHTAQILKECGIPAMAGVPLDRERDEGVTALMDSHAGRLYLEPTVELTEQLRRQYERGGCPVDFQGDF